MPPESATERLRRILVMVPWISSNPGATLSEIGARFGVDLDTLSEDLDLIGCSGIPPFSPDEMIEVWIDGDRVSLRMAEHLAVPPRLSRPEAVELLVRGRAVAALPGMGEAPALASALDKLASALGIPGRAPVEVDLEVPGSERVPAVRAAVASRQRLHIEYYSHGRGVMTERDIDPLMLMYSNGAWYVVAHDHGSDEERTFRLDRIRSLEQTGHTFAAEEAEHDAPLPPPGTIVVPSADDIEVTLDITPEAVWIVESVPFDRTERLPGGTIRGRLRTSNLDWVVRLLLAAGGEARPVRPPALRKAAGEAARAALAAYGEVAPTRKL